MSSAIVVADVCRDGVDPRYRWNTASIFPDRAAWDAELQAVERSLPELRRHAGQAAASAETLRACLTERADFARRISALRSYASRLRDEDTRLSGPRAMTDAVQLLGTTFDATTAYLEPEILKLSDAELERFALDPELADFDRYLRRLLREKAHVLSDGEEAVLANAGIMAQVPAEIYSTFTNSDMLFPTIADGRRNKIALSAGMYSRYRQSPDRALRKRVFDAFWSTYGAYRNTFAASLAGQLRYYDFVARTRRYASTLEMELVPKGVPVTFYERLVEQVNGHLPLFHRYLLLRKRMLKIRGPQQYYDVYPALTRSNDATIDYETAVALIGRAMAPLGESYVGRLLEGLRAGSGWVDLYPSKGKRSGAYSSCVYGGHPLVLMNYTGNWESVSTLAHEMGHAMHSVYANESQPYVKASYPIFLAEVASIVAETLLIDQMLREARDVEERKFYLAEYLQSFRGTVFRQMMFAEFEWSAYRAMEDGRGVTADTLDRLYLDLLRRHHGHRQGVMVIDERYAAEWSFVPHFYYRYYVYQYANGFIAATALVERIKHEGQVAAQRYIDKLLRAGDSMDPLETLKQAGVDMLDPEPYRNAMAAFETRLAQLEALAGE